ncbi:glycosyltransferase [Mucilaginibacter sp.]|uniref:glycosyltransferase n=1 Tax=Mucilaginibacter sp. TaxID=1882438 RepID=UPI002850BEC8|nr:glycosyltransferase [Mucilaginibacter sp.]MDR3697535.1 glycosyltransferase [Mucilaginibacter sp.]
MNPVKGGPSQGIRNIDKDLRKMGVFREVVCLDAPDSSYLINDDLEIHAIGPGYGIWHYAKSLSPWLIDNLLRFDVVIINGLWQYHSFITYKVINKLKKQTGVKRLPVILVMPHGMLDPYFQRAKERKIKAVRNWIYWKLIESKVVNNANGLLFTCHSELILARETFSTYYPQNEYNIGYGIAAPPKFKPDMKNAFLQHCSGFNSAEPYLLFLSRVHQKKGVDLLIRAYKVLADQYKNVPQLVIAGPGLESKFGNMIQQLASEDDFSKRNIFFTGMLTGDAKWGAYYGCDAFVLPSHQENFGIAVAEALACGKPVLISNQVNIWREIIGGAIIGTDDFEGTKTMLEKWLKLSSADRKIMSLNALQIYHTNFESLPSAQKLYNILNSIMSERNSEID